MMSAWLFEFYWEPQNNDWFLTVKPVHPFQRFSGYKYNVIWIFRLIDIDDSSSDFWHC